MKRAANRSLLQIVWPVFLIFLTSCQRNSFPGIPKDSVLQDEAFGFKIFLHVDDSTHHPKKVSIWSYNQETGKAKRIVSTTGEAIPAWYKSDTVKSEWPKDSISSIYFAKIISWPDEPLRLVVNGCPDRRNVWSYIVSEETNKAILLPSNAGFLGLAPEENLLIALSYEYYGIEHGGRYNVIKVFDTHGNLIRNLPAANRDTLSCYKTSAIL